MARAKTRLTTREEVQRAGSRNAIDVPGRCQIGERSEENVVVMDIDAHGCRIRGTLLGVTKADPLKIWCGSAGPFAARLKWAKRGSVGVAFDQPVDAETLQSLASAPTESNVLPLRGDQSAG